MYKLATTALTFVLLNNWTVQGVVNNNPTNKIQAKDRISNYSPPALMYGLPELIGSTDIRIYPPPPPELPPHRIPKPFYKIRSFRSPSTFTHYGPLQLTHIPTHNIQAPPTPPDIKYDGWQPIAGTAPSTDATLPNDSYGVPILSKEAQSLKQSVHQNEGLPPPPLPHYEPFYNQMVPKLEPLQSFAPPVGFEIYGPPLPPASRSNSQFALFTQSYLKHGMHHRGPFQPPLPPLSTMVPPRNRDALHFQDSINRQLLPSFDAPNFQLSLDCNNSLPPLDNSYLPPVGAEQLDLDSYEQSNSDLKDSYGNPIGLVTRHSNVHEDHLPLVTNSLDVKINSPTVWTTDLTHQSYRTARNNFQETGNNNDNNNNDGFEIQGSKGSYFFQIQSADGGSGTDNSEYKEVMTEGLIQDILAAIESPDVHRIENEDVALYFNNTIVEENKFTNM